MLRHVLFAACMGEGTPVLQRQASEQGDGWLLESKHTEDGGGVGPWRWSEWAMSLGKASLESTGRRG